MPLIFDASKKKAQALIDGESGEIIESGPSKEELEKQRQKVLSSYREFKFPERKKTELLDMYQTVCVRDFGDDYHKTDAQRQDEFELYDLYKPIAAAKSKYNKLEDFIILWRHIFKFIKAMAYRNRLFMSEKKFIKGVLRKDIIITGLKFPKYSGKDKKEINWKLVSKYIQDESLDVKDLIPKNDVEYLPTDILKDPAAHLDELFTPEQIKNIFYRWRKVGDRYVFDETIPERKPESKDKRWGVVRHLSKKKQKRFDKAFKELKPVFERMARNDSTNKAVRTFSYELTKDAYDFITKLDEKRGFFTEDTPPKFDGNIMSKKSYKRYMHKLDEWEEDYSRVYYHGRYMSLGDYKEIKLRDELDAAGWNVMKIYNNQEIADEQKREAVRLKKREKRIRKELDKIEDMKENLKMQRGESLVNNKKKKKSKKHKKMVEKDMKGFSDLLASASGTGYNNWEEYEEKMMDMCWDYKPGMKI